MTFDDLQSLCRERRSTHYFDDRPLARTDILDLLALASVSPSVQNVQPWHFHVILNTEMRTAMMEHSLYGDFIQGAGAFIVVTCNVEARTRKSQVVWNPRELEYSCVVAMTHLLLGATAKGIGNCWVSLEHKPIHALLRLDKHHTVVGGIMLGHYRRGEEKSANGHERGPLANEYTFYE